ncbi:hypothetical protein A5733_17930 [Mycobacterium sp. NS-7484]|uniref:hypothetical protein n=1 Tax=unclassified Mycobacterium TaxID=2642494 RepID=UPI0007FFABFF|nr:MULTISPECIES: hypothetical protein [unclassified Mycobacterium]OBG87226.1 hypothetical protein A5699_19570 [Mycobacterium sp. E802]OMC06105.1 hypothetical protein A5733_17930 [Mycobacterium sp. NS-7484]
MKANVVSKGVAIAGLLLMAACTSEDATAMSEPPPQPHSYGCADPAAGGLTALGATLVVDITPSDSGIQVRYDVVNDGAAPVYVVQLLTHPAFSTNYSPQNYLLTPGADGVVEVAKREYWPPASCQLPLYAAPPLPALSVRLDPGQRVSETFTVQRPFEVRNPYGADAVRQLPALPDPANRLRFCVGVAATATQVSGVPFPTDHEYHRFRRGDQRFLCSDPTEIG